MLSFIHTSDWHLGHVYRKLGARAGESAQWRFAAARRVLDLALEKKADFVLVAGDVFDTDTPSLDVIRAAAELLRDAPVPTYLISGNHDPLMEGSVWFHPLFADALKGVPHVHIARPREILTVRNGDALLFPCPVIAPHSREDATRWIEASPRSRSQARIGLAHGGWKGYWRSEEESTGIALNTIDNQTTERCGLDYLALGDYHSFTPANHAAAAARTYYSGTPEITAHDDARAGHALLVQLESPGGAPLVTPLSTGHAQSNNWGTISLQPGNAISTLQARSETITDRDKALVRARLQGVVSQNEWGELMEWIDHLRQQVLGADIDTSRLLTEPSRNDFLNLKLAAPELRLLEMLDEPLDSQDLGGMAGRDIIAEWSRDENARRAAQTLLYQLMQNE